MHFWIDKRSQCGYNWRRVPPSLSTGSGRSRRERHLKPMVTPVHRFQSVECVTGGSSSVRRPPGSAAPHLHRAAIPPSLHHYHQHHLSPHTFNNHSPVNNGIHHSPNQHRRGVDIDNTIYPDVSRSPAERSTSSIDQISVNRQLSDLTSAGPAPQPLMPAYLKCGVWTSFALATMFVAGAKFYFDHQVIYEQGSGMEVLVFCVLLVMFLLGACTISLCKTRAVPPLGPIVVTSQLQQSNTSPSQDSNEDLALSTLLNFQANAAPTPPPPEPPPPPYHIAVLLPQRNDSTYISMEAPPPSYEKAIS